MTRYARSKGSKGSNERVPEESTSWTAMKQQLLENNNEVKNRDHEKAVNEQKKANYQKFLKEKEEEESKHAVWASFPIQRNKSLLLNHKLKNVKGKTESTVTKINKKKLKVVSDLEKNIENVKKTPMDVGDNCNIKKGKKYKLQNNDVKIDIIPMTKSSTKVKKTKLNQSNEKEEIVEKNVNNSNVETKKHKKNVSKSSKNKRKESTMNSKNENKAELTKNDLKKIEKKKQKRIKQLMKKKQFKAKVTEQNQQKQNNDVESKTQTNENTQNDLSEDVKTDVVDDSAKNSIEKTSKLRKQVGTQKSKKKVHSYDDYQKRKPHLPHKLFINGKELEIAYVEGFPVKKEDAERLKKLRKEMISKGLPRSQIDAALKLERRRAEKALAREKKKVCFNCRKSGHNLSECPELGKNPLIETTGSGICFKCGSTEHTHFECKVVRGLEYKFAQCFICNEQGHIARQCPDNARGLYPKGGACKVCGDVTHLKKDCPQYQATQHKLENSIQVEILGDSNPEVFDGTDENRMFKTTTKHNKIVKFV